MILDHLLRRRLGQASDFFTNLLARQLQLLLREKIGVGPDFGGKLLRLPQQLSLFPLPLRAKHLTKLLGLLLHARQARPVVANHRLGVPLALVCLPGGPLPPSLQLLADFPSDRFEHSSRLFPGLSYQAIPCLTSLLHYALLQRFSLTLGFRDSDLVLFPQTFPLLFEESGLALDPLGPALSFRQQAEKRSDEQSGQKKPKEEKGNNLNKNGII